MESKHNKQTTIGFIALGVVFLGSEFLLDYIFTKEAPLQAKIWFVVLLCYFYYIIVEQISDSKKNENKK